MTDVTSLLFCFVRVGIFFIAVLMKFLLYRVHKVTEWELTAY